MLIVKQPFNRTIVELKPHFGVLDDMGLESFNRTIVELKPVRYDSARLTNIRF